MHYETTPPALNHVTQTPENRYKTKLCIYDETTPLAHIAQTAAEVFLLETDLKTFYQYHEVRNCRGRGRIVPPLSIFSGSMRSPLNKISYKGRTGIRHRSWVALMGGGLEQRRRTKILSQTCFIYLVPTRLLYNVYSKECGIGKSGLVIVSL